MTNNDARSGQQGVSCNDKTQFMTGLSPVLKTLVPTMSSQYEVKMAFNLRVLKSTDVLW